jgi:hypothetical protein
VQHLEQDKHEALIRRYLAELCRDLAEMPGRSADAKLTEGLLLRFDGKESANDERMARAISFTELKGYISELPEAADLLHAIDRALDDGDE